jgi:hypothetical protein
MVYRDGTAPQSTIPQRDWTRCIRHAREVERHHGQWYATYRNHSERFISQLTFGKAGECLSAAYLRSLGLECTDPDFDLHDWSSTRDPDLMVSEIPMHVKTYSPMLSAEESYVFSISDPIVSGEVDPSEYVALVVVDAPRHGYIRAVLRAQELASLMQPPRLPRLRPSKRCVYGYDL